MVTLKRMGFALAPAELNHLTLDDFVTFAEVWAGDPEDAPRRATQDDIDCMLG